MFPAHIPIGFTRADVKHSPARGEILHQLVKAGRYRSAGSAALLPNLQAVCALSGSVTDARCASPALPRPRCHSMDPFCEDATDALLDSKLSGLGPSETEQVPTGVESPLSCGARSHARRTVGGVLTQFWPVCRCPLQHICSHTSSLSTSSQSPQAQPHGVGGHGIF